MGSKNQSIFSPDSGDVGIKLNRKKCETSCKQNVKPYPCVKQHTSKAFDLIHTPDLWVQVERSDIDIVQISVFLFTKHVNTKS